VSHHKTLLFACTNIFRAYFVIIVYFVYNPLILNSTSVDRVAVKQKSPNGKEPRASCARSFIQSSRLPLTPAHHAARLPSTRVWRTTSHTTSDKFYFVPDYPARNATSSLLTLFACLLVAYTSQTGPAIGRSLVSVCSFTARYRAMRRDFIFFHRELCTGLVYHSCSFFFSCTMLRG
jgi:hypothetical protein